MVLTARETYEGVSRRTQTRRQRDQTHLGYRLEAVVEYQVYIHCIYNIQFDGDTLAMGEIAIGVCYIANEIS